MIKNRRSLIIIKKKITKNINYETKNIFYLKKQLERLYKVYMIRHYLIIMTTQTKY